MRVKRCRVCYLIDSLGMGGAERMLHTLLAHLDRSHLEIRVAYFSERNQSPMKDRILSLGIPVDYIPIRKITQPTALPRLISYLRQHRFDLVHTQLVTAIVLGSIASKWLRMPSVATLHTLDVPRPGTRSGLRRTFMWWALRGFSDKVIAVSEQARRHHIEVGGLPHEKMIVLHNGVDLSKFRGDLEAWRASVRSELGIDSNSPVMITVAVLREPKGIHHMITAMKEILGHEPDARYVIVGSGPYEGALRAYISQSQLKDSILMLGQRDDIPQLLAAADIFVHPTLDDALPTVLSEAMASGKPIVASRVGGVPEMVQHGHNGVLVEPADTEALSEACLSLIRDRRAREAMGEASRRIASTRFDVEQQVINLMDIYADLDVSGLDG